MIVGKQKSFNEIKKQLDTYETILIAGCGECVTVCHAGGEREVEILASRLKLAATRAGRELKIVTATVERQCDPEFLEDLVELISQVDAVLTLGCGSGAQTLAQVAGGKPVIPGLNTRFIGAHTSEESWDERCSACGDCTINLYGGFCPVTRCPKNILNGPCGGSMEGHCEVNPERDCVWFQIIETMTEKGMLDELITHRHAKDWQTSKAGGVRSQKREEDSE